MSVGGFDVEINGVRYNLAEDAEGDHYVIQGEPLRPPNAVTVQGENQQKFQVRPDLLLWSLTDWSGGEGQQKFDPQAPNRWRELTGVRVFNKPGTISPGWYIEETNDSLDATLAVVGLLAVSRQDIVLMDFDNNDGYVWDDANQRWGTAVALTGVTNGAHGLLASDDGYIYFHETSTTKIWKWDKSGAPSTISTTLVNSTQNHLTASGPYVYAYSDGDGKVWEIAKDGSGITLIDDFSDDPAQYGHIPIMAYAGKVYVAAIDYTRTRIREITPSSAAGTGFGAEVASLPGFKAQAMWSHGGLIYMTGSLTTTGQSAIMYYDPTNGTYGTLGNIRVEEDTGETSGQAEGGGLLAHYFAVQQPDASTTGQMVYVVDAVSGGMAVLGYNEDGASKDAGIRNVVSYGEDLFLGQFKNSVTKRTLRARKDQYTKSSEAISAWNDFGLADEKILSSLVMSCEDLPADWRIRVDYATDNGTTWTNVIDYTTTNGTGEKVQVTTDTSTVSFKTLSLRLRMDYTGAGIPTSGPNVLGIDAFAQVVKKLKTWNLLLDLSDDKDRHGGTSGYRKKENLETASGTDGAIDFKDGYGSYTPGVFDTLDVVVDSYTILLSQPGEGIARVQLREVV